ncbi:MAG TPA: cupin domain-containing protein, partial [Trueperaceae bacterium]|nr:cupin domain-containing protein [Trueperaceae bacterium]
HLCLKPGQRMPLHDHPGCNVTIVGLAGTATVLLDGASIDVAPHQLLSFPGESKVSPGNTSAADCAVLITLAERPVSADPALGAV